jgi:DNA repair protein RecO (recombination protein O)
MQIEVEGIVMRRTKYGEGSLIADLLTPNHDIITIITSGLSSKKGQHKSALLQLGCPVQCVIYYKDNRSMHRLKEISATYHQEQIPFSLVKGTILLFIIELMRNAIGKRGSDFTHYEFLLREIKTLDQADSPLTYFPLAFSIKLSQLLGFGPNLNTFNSGSYFDLQNGVFSASIPNHPNYLSEAYSNIFNKMCMQIESDDDMDISIAKKDRRYLLDQMMHYYTYHIERFRIPNAKEILTTVFNN